MLIDFTKTDNLIFLAIVFVLFLLFIFILVVIISKIIKLIKKLISRLKFRQEENVVKSEQPKKLEEDNLVEKLPEYKTAAGVANNFGGSVKKTEEKNKDVIVSDKEKSDKAIKDELSKLKSINNDNKDTLGSKMPSRLNEKTKGQGDDDVYQKIEIPTSVKPSVDIKTVASPVQAEKPYQAMGDLVQGKNNLIEDSSIFKGASEVSRIELEHEMRRDTNVWKAAKQEGLALNPAERAKLVKEVFPSVLGRNISKTDLKFGIKKLNQKLAGTKDSFEHAKIRKEVKFFKKIGGIK